MWLGKYKKRRSFFGFHDLRDKCTYECKLFNKEISIKVFDLACWRMMSSDDIL